MIGKSGCPSFFLGIAGAGQLQVQGERGSVFVAFDNIQAGPLQVDLQAIRIKNSLLLSVRPKQPNGVGYVVFQKITLLAVP